MATKFYLAEIPDDFPATNVKFENMTKPLLAIPPKMVDGKPITIVGYIDAGQKNEIGILHRGERARIVRAPLRALSTAVHRR